MTFVSSNKPLPEDLQKRIKPCPIDFGKIQYLIKRAEQDLKTAKLIRKSDSAATYQLLYEGMLHTALAYMVSDGAQPDIRGKHKTVIDYVAFKLGAHHESNMEFYDRMRRKRHQLMYEPGPCACTEKELDDAQKAVRGFIALISDQIKENHPKNRFDF